MVEELDPPRAPTRVAENVLSFDTLDDDQVAFVVRDKGLFIDSLANLTHLPEGR